jgi:regulator of protease activity HflC (stomatin/prohibitin superfamily)
LQRYPVSQRWLDAARRSAVLERPIGDRWMTVGEFLKQVFEWLYQFWPIRIIHDWEQGVRCRLGNATSKLTSTNGVGGTGLHAFWPLVGEINVYETNIEVSETELQTHTTADGVQVTISVGVKYHIFDLKRMYQNIHDPVETLENEICCAVGDCVVDINFGALSSSLCDHVAQQLKEQMGEWGIEIVSLSLINLSNAQPIRLITTRPVRYQPFD